MELYIFLLKIIDDEEFVGSGKRSSAIPLEEVGTLVTFLKNLGFTLYYNSAELNSPGEITPRDTSSSSLGRIFGNSTDSTKAITPVAETKPLVVAGLPGLTIDYLKGVITELLRQIYERDSRRRFLPPDHWLMTSRFDMTSFIPGVVAEEESRHQVEEQDEEDKDAEVDDDELYEITPSTLSPLARGHASALRSQEARARAQQKASRRRYLESVAPRLEIVRNMPFFIPFHTRVEIFRQSVQLDQTKRRNGITDPDMWRHNMMFNPPTSMMGSNGMPPHPGELLARHHAKIRRKNEFSDAFEQYYELGADLKEPIQITFEDEFGMPEAGIDGGGVTKEFLTSVIGQAFDPENENMEQQFFIENEKHLLYPNPTAIEDLKIKWRDVGVKSTHDQVKKKLRTLLQQYEFLGRVIGKCLYEGILVDVSFAGFFLKKWALTGGKNQATFESGYRANINDLRELDEGLYKGLLSLKNCPPDEVEALGLTFTVDDMVGPDNHKEVVERELLRDGANVPVTAENRLLYLDRMSRYRLQGQSAQQTNAFLKGLGSIIQPSWLNMFNQSELQTLVAGAQAEINIQDLRRHTLYGGTYVIGDDGQEHPSVQLFWKVMQNLPDADRRAVLKFVTSTPRGPLLGFGSLNPRFSIRDSGQDENRYPTTSTCVNLLKLPMYRSEKMLREKLLAAVNSGAGFDLS
jgi:ubiquitin-protein ligase E3 C